MADATSGDPRKCCPTRPKCCPTRRGCYSVWRASSASCLCSGSSDLCSGSSDGSEDDHRADRAGEQRTRRSDVMGFAEHPDRARRLPAPPHPFQPTHHRDPAQAGHIAQHAWPATVAGRHHPARRAAGLDLIRLRRHDQSVVRITFNVEHVQTGNIKDRIGSGTPARTSATHRVGHRRGLRQTAWMLLSPVKPDLLVGIDL